MSDICLNCQGLIMEPNVAYGYAGKVCFCPIDPKKRYQRPSLNEKNKSIQSNKTPPPVGDERVSIIEIGWVDAAGFLRRCGHHQQAEMIDGYFKTTGKTDEIEKLRTTNAKLVERHNADLDIIARLEAESEELRKDRERLEWMIETSSKVEHNADGFWVKTFNRIQAGFFKNGREAIDAAMKESGRGW